MHHVQLLFLLSTVTLNISKLKIIWLQLLAASLNSAMVLFISYLIYSLDLRERKIILLTNLIKGGMCNNEEKQKLMNHWK